MLLCCIYLYIRPENFGTTLVKNSSEVNVLENGVKSHIYEGCPKIFRLQGPKSIHLVNGLLLLALCHVVSLPVRAPLRIVNRWWSGFPYKWLYINVETFNLI